MLRTDATALSPAAARTWADVVGLSGGMALVSDDLALLGPDAASLFGEVLAMGRRSDEEARAGDPARCQDLLAGELPTTLASEGQVIRVDLEEGTADLGPRGDQRNAES
jgi:hypothetical protein